MRVETVAVGGSRRVPWQGREVITSIFKVPVAGFAMARGHNLEGDRQSDLEAHGGEFKAVYAYAAEHYDWWQARLGRELEPANFGENLTITGFDEPLHACPCTRSRASTCSTAATRTPCAGSRHTSASIPPGGTGS